MSNSSLVSYTLISPNKTVNRTHVIDTISIHCYVGQVTVERMGRGFANPSAEASSNYGVGLDGSIGMFVEEKDRSWCTSSPSNDHRAVTIEVACDTLPPYAVNDKAYDALIRLVADICKRNGIKKLLWKNDPKLIGQIDKQNMTVHRWFANKACPGQFLLDRHPDIANKVNQLLAVSNPVPDPAPAKEHLYRVRKSWDDKKSQVAAYRILENAKKNCPIGYKVFDENGEMIYERESVKLPDIDPAYSRTDSLAGAYKVRPSAGLHIRVGASTSKASIDVLPKGSIVRCYGYHTREWLLVKDSQGRVGYCHKDYLDRA